MSRAFVIGLIVAVTQLSVAQLPFTVSLSQKHISKIEQVKTGKEKLRLYRKYYQRDSVSQAKQYKKLLKEKYDSLLRAHPLAGIHVTDSASRDSLIAEAYNKLSLDSISIAQKIGDFPESAFGGEATDIKNIKEHFNSFSADSVKSLVSQQAKSWVEDQLNSSEKLAELQKYKAQADAFDPWKNEHVSVEQFQDTTYLKETARKLAEEKALEYLSEHSELLDPIQKSMDRLMKKFKVVPNSNDLSTAIKHSSLNGKAIRERLFLALNAQVISLEPLSVDISPMVGYKFNTRFIMGVGGLYRQTFNDTQVSFAPDVLGYKGFMSYEPLNQLFAYTEYARNSPGIQQSETGTIRIWKDAWLVGAGRRFEIHPKLDMTILIAYNVLKTIHDPLYPGPLECSGRISGK